MKKILNFFFAFSFCFFINGNWKKKDIENKVLIIDPVVDSIGFSLLNKFKKKSILDLYNKLPYSVNKGLTSCLRLHQFLFNEVLKVKKKSGDEVECEIDSAFYYYNNKKSKSYWILKKNIVYLKDLPKSVLNIIPNSYLDKEKNIVNKDNILTLAFPWFDSVTKKTYSAGTRFVRNLKKDTKNKYSVFLFDLKNFKPVISFIPKKFGIIKYPADKKVAIRSFINLIRKWINKNWFMPYLWGGCSFITKFKENKFKLKKEKRLSEEIAYWIRPKYKNYPYTGCDCSSLILRVAQILGMPYFCKNTNAIFEVLKPLKRNEKLQEGDLIWYKGHVQIVSDINRNMLIESVGYSFGYGWLHEIELEKVFFGVKNYKDLLEVYHNRKPIQRKNKIGKFARNIDKVIIFKLESIYS